MEVLQFAINMELEGERYYHEQAVKYADSALKVVFDLLAEDEAKHADILRSKMTGKAYTLKAQEKLTSQMGVFSGAAESSPEAGAKMMHELIDELGAPPHAFMCSALLLLEGALQQIRAQTGKIDKKILIGTFDDHTMLDFLPNRVLSIRQNEDALARRVFERLVEPLGSSKRSSSSPRIDTQITPLVWRIMNPTRSGVALDAANTRSPSFSRSSSSTTTTGLPSRIAAMASGIGSNLIGSLPATTRHTCRSHPPPRSGACRERHRPRSSTATSPGSG